MMKLLTLSLLFLFTACVTTPKPDSMKRNVANYTLPKLPKDGYAIVYMVRPANLGAMIKFNVFVDNKEAEVGYTKGKEYLYFYLPVGKHQILSKASNWATMDVDAKEREIIFVEQKPKSGFPLPSNSLLRVVEYEGKYWVKHLKLGKIIKKQK